MSLSTASLKRPVTTVAATLALVLLGAVSLDRLPVTLLPDVTLPVLTIRTLYPGAAATEASRFVAEPVEEAIAATPGLVELRSVSRNGEVTTTARFAWGTDMAATVLTVRERLDNARAQLPETAERPTLLTSDPGQRPIAVLGVTGKGDLRATARLAEQVLARRLEQLDGIASVAVTGAPEDEIRVELDPARLRALNLTTDNVVSAIQSANASAPGGTIRRGQFRFSVRALTELRQLDEFAGIPVGPSTGRSGGPVRLADVGSVSLATADPRTLTRLDGAPGIGLVVYKDAGANTVAVTGAMVETVERLQQEFPDVRLRVVAAQARFVTDALANLTQEIVAGGLLSLFLILLFLRDWRSALAIGLIVPLSVLVSLTALQLMGVTINVLSLGGLALGVGLLVDNAIVVSEATGRYREEGLGRWEAARVAADEVAGPLIAGTLTTVLVFGPIVFVRGLAAALFRDLSLAVVTSLTASLILALTLMPVMLVGRRRGSEEHGVPGSGFRVPGGDPPDPARNADPGTRNLLTRAGLHLAEWYEHGMMWSLDHPRTVFGVSLAATVAAGWLMFQLPREILPQVDEGVAIASLRLPEGTAIEETARQAARVEAAAAGLGSKGIYTRIGAATDEELVSGAEPGGPTYAQLLLPVPDGANARVFADRLRARIPDLAQGALAIDLAGQSEFGSLIGREGRLLRVEVASPDRRTTARWTDSARTLLAGIPGLTDIRDAYAGTQPVVELGLERERIALRGLSIDAVADAIAGGLGGVKASELRETDRRTPIRVRYAGSANEDLATTLTATIGGVPLGQLVSVREVRDPVEVVRVGQRPVQVLEAAVERGGTARAVDLVRATLAALPVPAGLTWDIAGADTEQRRTLSEMGIVAALSVALMFLVLAGEFASFSIPLLVMLTVPLAAVGGIVVLWMTGQSLNAVSLIGMVVMIGLADNDAVVKLDAIRRFREEGHPIREAVLLGGRQRLRAIAMTSLTTIVGVLPLVFGWGSGGELYQPLAAGVIGGSVTATLVTFFLLPTAYAVVEQRAEARAARLAAEVAGGATLPAGGLGESAT
ncbi:MAG TPA: efflux RND transporter permease subunit [Gemmatimonadales bacterium]|nr:efflux RND transporter permease subunit [Gemmatimonadales bacterium]